MNGAGRLGVTGGVAALLSTIPLLSVTDGARWLLPAVLGVALVVASGYGLRHARVPAVLVPPVQLVVLALWLGVLVAGDVAWLGVIPNPEWVERMAAVYGRGVETIVEFAVPVPVTTGLLMLLVGGAGIVAVLVDLLVVALRRSVLAGFALVACYAITAGVARGAVDWWWFVPPAAGFMAVLVSDGRSRVSAWGRSASPSPTHSGAPETDSLVRNGRRVGAVALAAAVAVPALIPALTQGFVGGGSGAGGGGGRTIRTDNPVVDLQDSLTRPDNAEVLSYTTSADAPRYIRTVALDEFEDGMWTPSKREVEPSQQVTEGMPPPPGLRADDLPEAQYSFAITDNYASKWLPLPYPAIAVDINGDWRYDVTTLDVVAGEEDTAGARYDATVLQVEPTPEMLQGVGPYRSDVGALTELPDDVPELVTDLAADLTADASGDWARAVALQDFFRNTTGEDGFTYSLDAAYDDGNAALADFLTERRGYCQHFAFTMAVMARSLDIPARVAVGFTRGDFEGDSTWTVRLHDSHAWPELYFEGIGWVPFEPTPAARTGLPPAWTRAPDSGGGTVDDPNPGPSTPVPTSTSVTDGQRDDTGGAGGGAGGGLPNRWLGAALLLGGAGALVCVPWLFARSRREVRWRRAADDPAARAEAAWTDVRDAMGDAGLSWNPSETPRMAGVRVRTEAHLDGDDVDLLRHVVDTTERARYSASPPYVESLREDVVLLRGSILDSATTRRRIAAFLWPSSVTAIARSAGGRMVDALDWVDSAGARLRASLLRAVKVGSARR